MVRILTDSEVERLLVVEELVDAVAGGLIKQTEGAVERPTRPHYPIGRGSVNEEPTGMGLVMPAYIHGATYFVTKLVSLHEENPERGLPTIHAQLLAADAVDGRPAALFDATLVTGARTGCIGACAVRELCEGPITLGVLGAGTQARWQTRAIDAVAQLESVRIYSPSKSKLDCAAELQSEGIAATAVSTPIEAVSDASVVVTATTSHEPVFPADALRSDALVIAVGAYTEEMQEIEASVVEAASLVLADVPEEVATIGDIAKSAFDPDELIPLGSLLAGEITAPTHELILVESVGSAVLDAAAAELLLEQAIEEDIGHEISFGGQSVQP